MKAIITLVIILGLSQFKSYSNDWDLFQKNQLSLFKTQLADSFLLSGYLYDSNYIVDFSYPGIPSFYAEYQFFNTKLFSETEFCKQMFFYNIEWKPEDYNERIDTLELRDSIFHFWMPALVDTFIFKPYSKVNESWNTLGFTFECIKLDTLRVFGDLDSAKYFKVSYYPYYESYDFILSKKHGFVTFIPFNLFFDEESFPNTKLEIIGYKNEAIKKGFVPSFSDFFKLNIGDRLVWKALDYNNDLTQATFSYRIDTINNIFKYGDSIRYDFYTKILDENGVYKRGYTRSVIYRLNEEGNMVTNFSNWFGLKPDFDNGFEIFFSKYFSLRINNNDTIVTAEIELPHNFTDSTKCGAGWLNPDIMSYIYRFNNREGVIYEKTNFFENTLIGSKINGEYSGDFDLLLGTIEPQNYLIKIFPNPATDIVRLEVNNYGIKSLALIDACGNLIEKDINIDNIDVKSLKPGLYVFRIELMDNQMIFQKIIKE